MSDDNNDIAAVMAVPIPGIAMKLAFGRATLEDVKVVVDTVGKVVIDIGDQLTLLHLAAQNNQADICSYLLKNGHPTELKTVVGETALDQACWRGYRDCVMVLLRYNADVDCQTLRGYTPLHRCAFYNHPRLASLLLLAGANQKLRDFSEKQTPYECAVEKENKEVAELLKPLIDNDGNDISGIMYATNNPKHPNFRPEARQALFALADFEDQLSR